MKRGRYLRQYYPRYNYLYNSAICLVENNGMQTITLNSHVGQDGILHLDIPVDVTNTDLTITVI